MECSVHKIHHVIKQQNNFHHRSNNLTFLTLVSYVNQLIIISILLLSLNPYHGVNCSSLSEDNAKRSSNDNDITSNTKHKLKEKQKKHFNSFQHRSLQGNTNIDVDYPLHHPFHNNDNNFTANTVEYYKSIRIVTETSQIDRLLSLTSGKINMNNNYNTITEIDKIKINILLNDTLPNLIKKWSNLLKVIPIQSPINIMDIGFGITSICDNQVDISTLLNYNTRNITTDFLAFIEIDINCAGYGTLAYSHPCQLDQFDRPIIGRIVFCLDSIDINSNSDGIKRILLDTAIHEMGHLLGIHSQLMPYYRNSTNGTPLTNRPFKLSKNVSCVDGISRNVIVPSNKVLRQGSLLINNNNNQTYYEIITPLVKTIAQNQFNCYNDTIINGARLEMMLSSSSTNDDCFGSHFDERLYFTEIMSSIYNSGISILSPLTLALLEDTGWYKANYSTAYISNFGYGSGCDFISKDCIINGTIPDYSNGAFCNTTISTASSSSSSSSSSISLDHSITDAIPTCDPTYYQVSLCDLIDHTKTKTFVSTLSKQSNYFDMETSSTTTNNGQQQLFDKRQQNNNYPQNYFPNNPSLGPMILKDALYCPIPHLTLYDCRYNKLTISSSNNITTINKRKNFEIFGHNSRCFNVKISTNTQQNNAFCFEMSCNNNNKSIDINVNGIIYTCYNYMKEIIIFSENNMILTCPSFITLCSDLVCPANCSGRGKCNFKTYKCECYDSNDKSETCANSSWLGAASGVNNHIIGTLSSSSRNGHDGASSDSNKQYVLHTKKIYCIIFILGLFSWC